MQKAYYQRNVAKKDRWKLAVITHRGQEILCVAPMGYVNSPSHVQRLMDKVLVRFKAFAKCYIDDIVIFSNTFEDHVQHIETVLGALSDLGITLSPDKCFVGYHSVELLGHKVDRFGLSTLKEKTAAIAAFEFPATLKELDYFIGLAGYYRQFVARFAKLIEPLQKRKTSMFKPSPSRKGRERDSFSRSTRLIDPTPAEHLSFQLLKDSLCSGLLLIHPDFTLPLLYYVDASQEGGYALALHQVPKASMESQSLNVADIMSGKYDRKLEKPVMYLSRLLNKHEANYWPTELEIAAIVWAVQKTRYMVEGAIAVKLYTDHQAAQDILSMKTFKPSSTVRQNLRLIRASQFISQYPNIVVVHRPGKDNTNADALSRLRSVSKTADTIE